MSRIKWLEAYLLQEKMRRCKMSVNAMAHEAGIAQPVLHRFSSGERTLTVKTARKLSKYLDWKLNHMKGVARQPHEVLLDLIRHAEEGMEWIDKQLETLDDEPEMKKFLEEYKRQEMEPQLHNLRSIFARCFPTNVFHGK